MRKKRTIVGILMFVLLVFIGVKILQWNQLKNYESIYDKTENELKEIKVIALPNDVLKMDFHDIRKDMIVSRNFEGEQKVNWKLRQEVYYREVVREIPAVLENGSKGTRRESIQLKFEFESPLGPIDWSNNHIKLKVTVDSVEVEYIEANGAIYERPNLSNNLSIDEMMIYFYYEEDEVIDTYRQEMVNHYYNDKNKGKPEVNYIKEFSHFEDNENPVIIKWDQSSHNRLKQVGDYCEVDIELSPGSFGTFGDDEVEKLTHEVKMDFYLHAENDTILAKYFGKDAYSDFIKFTKTFEYTPE